MAKVTRAGERMTALLIAFYSMKLFTVELVNFGVEIRCARVERNLDGRNPERRNPAATPYRRARIVAEIEEVGAIEMSSNIDRQVLLADALEVDPGEDDHLGVEGGTRHILPVRTDHTASAVEDEFAVVASEAARNFKIAGQVAAAHNGTGRDYEAAP